MVEESKIEKYSSYAYIIFGLSLVITIAVLLFIIKPLWENNKIKQGVVKNKESKLSYLEDKLGKLEKLSSKENEINDINKKISAALPTFKDKSKLFMQFEGLKVDNGFFDASFGGGSDSANAENTITGVSEMSYSLETKSITYDSLKNFLKNYKSALRLLRVDRLDIKLAEEGKEIIGSQMDVKTFYRSSDNGDQQ